MDFSMSEVYIAFYTKYIIFKINNRYIFADICLNNSKYYLYFYFNDGDILFKLLNLNINDICLKLFNKQCLNTWPELSKDDFIILLKYLKQYEEL